jgi:signal transduction histidine kinase
MLSRILVLISLVVLLAIFGLYFKITIPILIDYSISDASEELAETRARRLVNMLTLEDKETLSKLPCDRRNKCGNIQKIKDLIDDYVTGGAINGSELIAKTGKLLFSGTKLSQKYSKILNDVSMEDNPLETSQKIQIYEDEEVQEYVTVAIDLYQISEDRYLENIFLVSNIDVSEINSTAMHYYIFSAAGFFVPLGIIFLIFMGKETLHTREIAKIEFDKMNFESEVEKLKRENVQQSQFLANFTHELRTPLNSIIGFSGLLKDETLGPLGNEEYIKYAEDINNSGVHLLSLINDILDYSKAEVGRLQVNMTETDIMKIIKQCFSIVAPRASESEVELLQSFSSDHCIIDVDSKRFKQIILNLLSNSVKFTPKDGSVTVSIFPDIKGERMYVEVKDTGVGIEEKDIPTVMSLFGQVETDLNRKYEGTGIGLPFAKKLTTLMGGTFEISSKVGIGTRITLGFPFDKKLNSRYAEKYS